MSSEMIGLVNDIFRQTSQSQPLTNQSPKTESNFESYLQDDKEEKQIPETTPPDTDLETKMQQLQDELNRRISGNSNGGSLPQLLQEDTRIGLLQKATQGLGNEPNGKNLFNNFVDVEKSWKEVESMMRSKERLSQGELLALQARLYQVSHQIEVMSKVVDQMAGGVKTILNTNV